MLELPNAGWYRPATEQPPVTALARRMHRRDAATVRALRAYLDTKPAVVVHITIELDL